MGLYEFDANQYMGTKYMRSEVEAQRPQMVTRDREQ